MEKELCRRVGTFLKVELICGEIYDALAEIYPEDGPTWTYFSTVEKNHSITALIALKFCRLGKFPEEFREYLADVDDTLQLAKNIKDAVKTSRSLTKDMAHRIIELEDSACKIHFRQLMKMHADSEIISNLQKLLIDVDQHVEELRSFLESKDLVE